jgi:hypothetical protein
MKLTLCVDVNDAAEVAADLGTAGEEPSISLDLIMIGPTEPPTLMNNGNGLSEHPTVRPRSSPCDLDSFLASDHAPPRFVKAPEKKACRIRCADAQQTQTHAATRHTADVFATCASRSSVCSLCVP